MKGRVLELKKRKKAFILAHNYQILEIQEVADYVGDSLEMAKVAAKVEEPLIVVCGVRFMAETVKILAPEKKVLIPDIAAGCPLAESITPEDVKNLKKKHAGAPVVAYVNTEASIKACVDVCCTSANSVKVVSSIPNSKIIFVPDKNLGNFTKKCSKKELILWQGYCPVHVKFTVEEIEQARRMHPRAEILVHPECEPEVVERADFVLSTSGMIKRVGESQSDEFVVGTEIGLIDRLKKLYPDKKFYSLGEPKICEDMKKITLQKLVRSLEEEIFEIKLDEEVIKNARRAIEKMVRL